LSPQAAALVAQSRSILSSKADPAQPLVVTGYTDSKGTPAFNQTLSRKRTTAVAKTLRSEGFTSFRLRVSGRGEDDPVALNATESGADNPRGRALNRRVEITYTPKPTPEPAPVATATTSTAPTATTAETPAAENSAAVITLPQANVKSDGVSMARMTVGVHPVIETGALSLVQLDITAVHDTLLLDAFSARAKADQDISAFSIVDPATKRVYVPAYDADDRERVAGTYTRRLSAGQPQHLAFYAAALPPGLTTATVDLGQLGSAKRVTVVH
jgi:OOP family OmpA-OmpF porin